MKRTESENMGLTRIGTTWLVRVGIATATLTGIGMMAEPGKNIATGAMASVDLRNAGHAILLFAIVWFLASLRVQRRENGWRFGFDPFPVRSIAGQPASPDRREADGHASDSF
ncbi:MAG: hypothetical protein H0T56_01820 [Pseudaminobacter sp.]|nr:hypothetical protein [Pseudaminobacter sp.]